MAKGYLVTLGDGTLDAGDAIDGALVAFDGVADLGPGTWTFSGVRSDTGEKVDGGTGEGTYHQAGDGSVYFVPTGYEVSGLTGGAAGKAPAHKAAASGPEGRAQPEAATMAAAPDRDAEAARAGEATAGDDTIVGSDGDDDIRADAGADTVRGGRGDDRIDLGADRDADTVVIADGDGHDTVTSFAAPIDNGDGTWSAQDRLDLSGLTGPSGQPISTQDVRVSDDGIGNAVLSFPGGESVRLMGVSPDAARSPGAMQAMGIPGPDGTVSGTAGDDLIDAAYAGDPDGDRVDAGDALIPGAEPNDDVIVAGDGRDRIYAGSGDDAAFGGAGNDSLYGGGGGDTLVGDEGDDVLDGGSGADVLTGGTGRDRMLAGTGRDVVLGEDDDDSLGGGADADVLFGGDGNDAVSGDDGDDMASGGLGDDVLFGGAGADTLTGDGGNDALAGGAGTDSLSGGDGADGFVVQDTSDVDVIAGGEGGTDQDTLTFQNATTTAGVTVTFTASEAGTYAFSAATGSFTQIEAVQATAHDDVLNAAAAASAVSLHGLAGNDSLAGGSGADVLDGGAGNDTLAGGLGADSLVGGTGLDIADYAASNAGVTVDLQAGTAAGGHAQGDAYGSVDGVVGSAFDDVITGYDAESTAPGDPHTNLLSGGAGNDLIDGRAGADTIFGGADNDSILGGDGNDSLDGGSGNDALAGGAGADSVQGGGGADRIEVAPSEGADTVAGGEGGTDADTLAFTGAATGVSVTFGGNEAGTYAVGTGTGSFAEIERIEGTGAADTVNAIATASGIGVAAGGGADSVIGGTGADSISGDDGDDTLGGNDGADSLYGGAGNDRLVGGTGADRMEGGADADSFALGDGAGADAIFGGSTGTDSDTLDFSPATGSVTVSFTGSEAGTTSQGATFSDIERLVLTDQADAVDARASGAGVTVDGGAGGDTLLGGAGADSFEGGAGDDRVGLDDGFGADAISGGEAGEAQGDVLDATAVDGPIRLDLSHPEAGTLSSGGSTATFAEIERVELGGGADSVTGSAGADRVSTGAGADTVRGGLGDDRFDLGDDAARDVVVLADGDGDDDLTNFGAPTQNPDGSWTAEDALNVAGLTDGRGGPVTTSHVAVTDDGAGNAVLTFPDGTSVRLLGVPPSQVSSPQALHAMGIPLSDGTVTGTAGGDLIDGGYLGDPDGDRVDAGDAVLPGAAPDDDVVLAGGGDDTVLGDAGADRAFGGAGDDSLYGGDGGDTLSGDDGDDTLDGGDGDDALDGGAGDDRAFGGTGDDTAFGGDGTDTLAGGDGNDTLDGGSGADSLDGGAGNDALFGGAGSDRMDGGAGDDALAGGDDADTLTGQAGNDTLSGQAGDDGVDGGTGDDTVYGGSGTDSLAGGDGRDQVAGGDGADRIDGGAGNDVIEGDAGDDSLSGGLGDDSAFGGDGADSISGGDGNDFISGSYGDDAVDGGGGSDLVFGEWGSDRIDGGAGDDTTYGGLGHDASVGGGDGNDLVSGRYGDDTAFGGAGDDTVYGDIDDTGTGARQFAVYGSTGTGTAGTSPTGTFGFVGGPVTMEAVDDDDRFQDVAGSGNADATPQTLAYAITVDGVTYPAGTQIFAVSTSTVVNQATGQTGQAILIQFGTDPTATAWAFDIPVNPGDQIAWSAGSADTTGLGYEDLVQSDNTTAVGNDTLFGGDGDDTMSGADGRDSLSGDGGADALYGGEDADRLSGGDGDDRLDGGAGDDALRGDAGADSLSGGDGDDTLDGGLGADSLSGGAGDDALTVAQGDVAEGGDGDDTFVLADLAEAGAGSITVTGGEGGETLGDTLDLGSLADLSTLVITTPASQAGGQSGHVTLDDGTILHFSEIETIICFAAGTLIATPRGARAVESLRPGDLVVTRDHGLQPLRWAGARRVPAAGRLAPVRIRPGVVPGLERDLVVSPQHRMLFQGHRAELLFGESEVLVPALHLIDGLAVTREAGGHVTYCHLLFDRHEVVYAEGAATESFHPGEVGLGSIEAAAREELFEVFPELRALPRGYGAAARRSLKAHEARLIRG